MHIRDYLALGIALASWLFVLVEESLRRLLQKFWLTAASRAAQLQAPLFYFSSRCASSLKSIDSPHPAITRVHLGIARSMIIGR